VPRQDQMPMPVMTTRGCDIGKKILKELKNQEKVDCSLYFRVEFRYLGSENLKSTKIYAGIFEEIRKSPRRNRRKTRKRRQPLRRGNQNEVRERIFNGISPFSLQKKVS